MLTPVSQFQSDYAALLDRLAATGAIGLVLQNYLKNKEKFLGIGNYNEQGFAFMEKGKSIVLDTFKKALLDLPPPPQTV